MTPEGLCTRCSATNYCDEHAPAQPSDAASLREAVEWIRALKPRHWPGECDHCGIDELPAETCPVLAELARLDAWLTQRERA